MAAWATAQTTAIRVLPPWFALTLSPQIRPTPSLSSLRYVPHPLFLVEPVLWRWWRPDLAESDWIQRRGRWIRQGTMTSSYAASGWAHRRAVVLSAARAWAQWAHGWAHRAYPWFFSYQGGHPSWKIGHLPQPSEAVGLPALVKRFGPPPLRFFVVVCSNTVFAGHN